MEAAEVALGKPIHMITNKFLEYENKTVYEVESCPHRRSF